MNRTAEVQATVCTAQILTRTASEPPEHRVCRERADDEHVPERVHPDIPSREPVVDNPVDRTKWLGLGVERFSMLFLVGMLQAMADDPRTTLEDATYLRSISDPIWREAMRRATG